MLTLKKIVASLFLLLFTYFGFSQTFYSKRLNIGDRPCGSYAFQLYNDTFYIPSLVIETGPIAYSCCLLKVSKPGNIISQKRFLQSKMALEGGNDLKIKNGKFYISSISAYTMQIHSGYYIFDQNCDTVLTKYYGDTSYWNNGYKIEPYLKTKNKFLLIGITDSTCGPPHSGNYKVFVRVVDTNGVLYQTNLYTGCGTNRTVTGSDTTLNKGYVISGVQNNNIHYILKLDSNLNQQWLTALPNTTGYIINSIASLSNGEYVVSHTKTDSVSLPNYWDRVGITRLDKNGNIKWQKYYGVKQVNIATQRIRVFSNGDYVVCGEQNIKYTPTAQQIMGFILRTDSLGNLKWWNNYIPTSPVKDTIASTYLNDVIEMPDKSIAAVGYQNGSGYFLTDPQSWLLRLDSMGCLVPGCTPTITEIEKNNILSSFNFYPNPTNGKLIVEVSELSNTSTSSAAEIKITNVLGEEIKNEKLKADGSTTLTTELNINELSNGIYFLKLYEGNKLITTKKLIKQ